MNTTKIKSVRMSLEFEERLRKIAQAENRSLSNTMIWLLTRAVDQHSEERTFRSVI